MFPAPTRHEAGKANSDEPARQEVQQEAAQELSSGHNHLAVLATVGMVHLLEGDLSVGNV